MDFSHKILYVFYSTMYPEELPVYKREQFIYSQNIVEQSIDKQVAAEDGSGGQ